VSAFNALFDDTAAGHFALLGGETITLSRPHTLKDSRGRAIEQVRLDANASIGATSVVIEPLSGTFKGKLPAGFVLVVGVTTSAEYEIQSEASVATIPVVALSSALTAGAVWMLPPAATWTIADCLPFEERSKVMLMGSTGGDKDKQQQQPRIAIPVSAGVEPRAMDSITWSQGKAKVAQVKRMSDSYDVSYEVAA
jgi:hypothetical protein